MIGTVSLRRRAGKALVLASLAFFPLSLSTAQESNSGAQAAARPEWNMKIHGHSADELRGVLENRDRGFLHPGDPLWARGHEEGDNGFRHTTPLLEGAVIENQKIYLEEARERRLAMYGDSASFHSPLRAFPVGSTDRPAATLRRPRTNPADSPTESGAGGSLQRALMGLGLALGVSAMAWQRRQMLLLERMP